MADEQRELTATIMQAIDSALADLHTATVARVTRVNSTTIACRPITARVVDGEAVPLPEFVDVPPLFMQGGGSYTAHPVAVGDYCLLVFTERAFDRWYRGDDYKAPVELRMHDYSDGIALVGVNPLSTAFTIPSVIQHTGDANQDGDYTHQGTMTREGDTQVTGDYTIIGDLHVDGNITCTGNITCQGTVAAANFTGLGGGAMESTVDIKTTGTMTGDADVVAGTVSLKQHTHTDSQGGTTSSPN